MTHDVNPESSNLPSFPLPPMAEPHQRHVDESRTPVPPTLQAKLAAVCLPSLRVIHTHAHRLFFAFFVLFFLFFLDGPTCLRFEQQEE